MGRVDTVLPADSTEFCPAPTCNQIFVCGTYQLEEAYSTSDSEREDKVPSSTPQAPQARRWGKCLLYEVNEETEECAQLQAITMPAVLDMKWSDTLLAITDAEGHVVLRRWQEENRRLDHIQTMTCVPENPRAICLSLDWAKHRLENHSDKVAVSISDGTVLIARQSDAGMSVTDIWEAHEFEPWVTAWDRWNPNVVYTGGDDCKLKGWDLRSGFSQPVFINKRFDAGVTTLQSNPHLEHTLAVGSYDSTVRLFDMRQPLRTVTQANVGGGAWRVKWHPDVSRQHHLLVACMHDGFKVLDFEHPVDAQAESWRVSKRFDQHESLAYGADWSYAPANKAGQTLVASCSFYDHALHLWRA